MTHGSTFSPEHVLAGNDPGDDTSRRFRFQWTWAAVVCCELLDNTLDVEEVFCEHHEDVLIKHSDGMFTGHQVKTRRDDQPPWKAKDEAVVMACARFVHLEAQFPGRFRQFCFLTNHPLYSAKNGQGLHYLLNSIKGVTSASELPPVAHSFVRKIAQKGGVTEVDGFAALSKTVASANLPKLRDAVMRLIDTIAQCWESAENSSHQAIRKAAHALVEECGRASSLDHEQLLPAYMIGHQDDNSENAAKVEGKRMTLDRVKKILEIGRDSLATLIGDPALYSKPGEGSTKLLKEKLEAGGFSAVSQNSAQDLRDKADYLGIGWTKRYGYENGLQRYDHICSLVLSDAGRSFDATNVPGDGFGPEMREYLRGRFEERREAGDQLFDTTGDHLEGVAFSLTAQCKVVWSHAKPWESDDGSG